MYIGHKPIKHTDYKSSFITNNSFSGVTIKNQPNTPLYIPLAAPQHWWGQGDLVKIIIGIGAYVNLGTKTGFGIGDNSINYGGVPKIIDRASPFMWI